MSESEPYRPKFGFDIRINPPPPGEEIAAAGVRACEWHGCRLEGKYRAPHSRERLNEHRWFCLSHVREFNNSWNFFEGLTDDEVRAFQAGASTGHRPTWRFGTIGSASGLGLNRKGGGLGGFADPFGLFGGFGRRQTSSSEPTKRQLTKRQTRAFEVFDIDQSAGKEAIRTQFKALVKRFHPDVHGGDKGMEERLREVIEAYQILRASGFC
ncbi:MAG TPA: J domain-containing protein [Alphaproteobacteria bacterium]|nr:J domain-containing protein [Alphaproteobacteria bacterium]